jgi:hypothetical protein
MSEIPTTSQWVDLRYLHPEFTRRLEKFFADPRVKGRIKIVSGCRTYAKQKDLYRKYKNGRGNLAANPDRRFGPNGFWKGSWHMTQDDGKCYAVDFRLSGRINWGTCHAIAEEYGLRKTVPTENWHMQPRDHNDWFPAPAMSDGFTPSKAPPKIPEPASLAEIFAFLSAIGEAIAIRPLKRGDTGKPVEVIQSRLAHLDFKVGNPDGKFGFKTHRAVRNFQRVEGLWQDGVVGRRTWDKLWGVTE